VELPYGDTTLKWEYGPCAVLKSRVEEMPAGDGAQLVEAALASPIGSPPLRELARGKKNAVLILSDHTRPVPSRDIVPAMLRELRADNPEIDITLLVATGFHRGTTRAELEKKLGTELTQREKIVVHDCTDPARNVMIGVLPSGGPCIIDRLAAETELLVSEGFIEPHFFAGFSGGRKSVLPGVSSRETVLANHCGAFIASEKARTGVLEGNPVHRDMKAAAEMAKLAFVVNVVINEEKKTAAAFAGHPEKAHLAGCQCLRSYCGVKAVPGDIVVTTNGGAPLDQNLYQCVKSLTAAEASAKPGAVLILCAECADGTGGDGFYRSLRDCESPAALYEAFSSVPADKTVPDQWESQILARVLMKHRVIAVTRQEMAGIVKDMKMDYAPDLGTAMAMAREEKGEDALVTLIPNGVSVIVEN